MSDTRHYDIVICDIDGCLTPEGPLAFDETRLARVAEHNRRAHDLGDRPVLTVCSGRPQPFAEAMCRLIHNMSVPCVAENGVWLYDPGTNDYEMDPGITEEHIAAVHEAERWMRKVYGPEGFSLQPGKAASVTLYHPDRDRLMEQVPDVQQAIEYNGWPLRVSTTWLYINCDLQHITKATGVARLVERVGIPKERLAGIGDTYGDRFIAENVGYFACPANADTEIRSYAQYVSPYSETAGVLDILERLARQGR